MDVIRQLLDKIVLMADEVGQAELDSKTDHYYEREVIDRVRTRQQISITEAIDAVTYLRSVIQEDS